MEGVGKEGWGKKEVTDVEDLSVVGESLVEERKEGRGQSKEGSSGPMRKEGRRGGQS